MHYQHSTEAGPIFTYRPQAETWFVVAEVDMEIPETLWMMFEELPPFFFTKQIPDEAVPQHMKNYCECTGRTSRW